MSMSVSAQILKGNRFVSECAVRRDKTSPANGGNGLVPPQRRRRRVKERVEEEDDKREQPGRFEFICHMPSSPFDKLYCCYCMGGGFAVIL